MKTNWPTKKLGDVYLIGVDHSVQWNRESKEAREFVSFLEKKISQLRPSLIAEEFSEQALKQNNVESTTVQDVAVRHEIKHIFCDPSDKEREEIGYPTKKQLRESFGIRSSIEGTKEHKKRNLHERAFWPLREKFWLDKIQKTKSARIIFICGSEHLESFRKLLLENGYFPIFLWPTNPGSRTQGVRYGARKLGEVLEKNGIIPAKIKRDDYRQSGKYPIVDQGENLIAGYIDDERKLYRGNLPVIVFGDHTRILKYIDFPFAFGADGIKILRPQATLLPKFFYYVLVFNPVSNQGYKRHFSLLAHIKIPLPPLEIQKQIVGRLDKIVEAQKLNDDLIQKADELFQSLLYRELDPADKDWEVKKLGDIINPQYGYTAAAKDDGKFRFIRITDIDDAGELRNGDKKYVTINSNEANPYELKTGDLLLARTGATYGKILYFKEDEPSIFASFLIRLNPDTSMVDSFYIWLFSRSQNYWRQAKSLMTGSGQPQFNANKLKQIKIRIPPLEIQKQIVIKLSAAQDYKTKLLAQKSKLKELFNSVLSKSFSSE